ncbi:MAG: non-ribosomal peptide synthetase [Gemmatimonadaceae bacterium]
MAEQVGEIDALTPTEKRALLRRLLEQRNECALSSGQQWLWLLQQLAPDSAAYHFPIAIRILSAFDPEVLRRSLQELVNRHAAFRTIFAQRDGQPVQMVQDIAQIAFNVIDASAWSEEELGARAAEESERPIDLTTGPVFRATLFQRDETEAVLLLVWHHIVLDGWSLALVLDELSIIHAAYASGREPRLPPAPRYTEFVQWQQQLLSSTEGARQSAFWLEQLGGAQRLDVITDRKRPAQRSYRGESLLFTIGEPLTRRIAELATAEETTTFVVLLAGFEALLHRMTGQDGILVSFPVNGRSNSRFANTAGYFVNQAAVACDIAEQTTFRRLVARTKAKVLGALDNQDYHLSLLPQSDAVTGAVRSSLSNVMFVLQKSQGFQLEPPSARYGDDAVLSRDVRASGESELGGLRVESFPLKCNTARFDLELQMMEHGGALRGWLQYDTDLFEEGTARTLADHFERLLSTAVDNVDQRVSELDILGEDERKNIAGWNRTQREWPLDGNIADVFERQVRSTPDAVAAVCGDDRLTFQELDTRANRVAQWLRRSGARQQDIVGLCVPRSLELLVALLGIVKAECIYLPLDPANPHERLKFMLKDSGAEFVIANSETCGRFRRSPAQQLCLHCDASAIGECPATAPARTAAPLLYVLYTSGSMGEPKGVIGTQAGALNRFHWMWDRYPFAPAEVCACTTTLGFVDAVWEIFGPLLKGVPIAMVPDDDVRDAERLTVALESYSITRITLVPSLLRVLLESTDIGERLSHLRYWSCSGEALDPELARRFCERVPNGVLLNLYGCSEVAADSCYFEIGSDRDIEGDRVPIGRPIANTQLLLLDRYGKPVPLESVGEIHIGGAGLAAGYLKRPELTAERFIANPFAAGERLYRTGDLGRYRSDGNVEYFGRADHQLKIRGNRVELGEVEAALRSHPEVESAAVRGVAEPGGDQMLVAYVVARSASLSDRAMRTYLARSLPSYMLPSHFVRLDTMPLTATGKINRTALPSPRSDVRASGRVAPRTETERALAEVWAQVLGVPQLGMEDDFFEWGGHSIHALQASARASKLFRRQLPVALLFKLPTVASFAAHLDGITQPESDAYLYRDSAAHRRHQLIAVQSSGTRPPLFWIPGGAGYLAISQVRELSSRLGPDQPFYGLATRRSETLADIESVAERASGYVAAIRELQPEGPYFLAGFCLGGVIAFETAQQLCAQGQQVAFVGLVNTWMPATSVPGRQWLVLFLQRAVHHARAAVRQDAAPVHQYLLRRLRAVRQARRRNRLAEAAELQAQNSAVVNAVAGTAGDDAILRATVRMASKYVPLPFGGAVHVFVSEEPDLEGVSARIDPRRAWHRVSAGCELIAVRGGHDEMLSPPLVDLFANDFGRCLREAQ